MILVSADNEAVQVKVINLKREYPGFRGEVSWALITSLTEKELAVIFGDQLAIYKPYMLLSPEVGEAWADFDRNEDKHAKRQVRSGEAFGYEEGISESVHNEMVSDTLIDDILVDLDIQKLREALKLLPDVQRRRIELYYFNGLSLAEVAVNEGVNVNAVNKSIKVGLKKLKKYFD